MIRILVDDKQRKIKINKRWVKKVAKEIIEQILKDKKNAAFELSILFVNNSQIREINKKFRGINDETDIIAFPQILPNTEHRIPNTEYPSLLGDVVISLDAIKKQAKIWNLSIKREFTSVLTHGILHLFGYKDKRKVDRERMYKIQNKILRELEKKWKLKKKEKQF